MSSPSQRIVSVSPAENPIEMVAAELQRLPPELRWLAANMQAAIEEIATGTPRSPGPREKRARRLLAAAGGFGMARAFATAGTALLLLRTWAAQFRVRPQPASAPLFIGIRALREPELERRFAALSGRPALTIDERDLANFFRHGRVGLGALLGEFRQVHRALWNGLASRAALGPLPRADLVTFFLLRGWHYVYLRAWFRQHLRQNGAARLIACTTASNAAHAAVAAGGEAVYLLHGFQAHSLIYPDFARALCFSGFEAEHIRRRLPDCAVALEAPALARLETRRVAAVAGIFWEPDGFDRIRSFLLWARQHDLPVVVRKHPFDTSDYWDEWRGVPGIEVREGEGSFDGFLTDVKPSLLATWHSTVLFDALLRGVVPVTVNADSAVRTVYPIRDLALAWPQQKEILLDLLADDHARDALVADLYARAMCEPGAQPCEPAFA